MTGFLLIGAALGVFSINHGLKGLFSRTGMSKPRDRAAENRARAAVSPPPVGRRQNFMDGVAFDWPDAPVSAAPNNHRRSQAHQPARLTNKSSGADEAARSTDTAR